MRIVTADDIDRVLTYPLLIDALAEAGVLIYETFAIGNARFGKPGNPDFLLERGELLARCHGLDIVAYEDGLVTHPKPASIQRICAIRDVDGQERHVL